MKEINLTPRKIFRSIEWFFALLSSLLLYWTKNPRYTGRILRFLILKIRYIPIFLNRNIEPEKYSRKFENLLNDTVTLYSQVNFDPYILASYKKLNRSITNPYQILYFLIRKLKPKQVVETGVAGGISSGFILQAIKDNGVGRLYSIDLPFQWYCYGESELHLDSLPAGKMSGYLVPESLRKNWKLIIGDTKRELPKLMKKLGKIDLFFHDSEHTYDTMLFEYNLVWPKLTKNGVLVSDDVEFTEAFNDFTKSVKSKKIVVNQIGLVLRKGLN